MLEGPIGGAAFNNEFGRPNLLGYFRTLRAGSRRRRCAAITSRSCSRAASGNVAAHRRAQAAADRRRAASSSSAARACCIGLGGGAASSMASGSNAADLDFDSVQRGNAEIQRRAQEVIDRCWQMGADNPILSIHDVGAGGLSNALARARARRRQGGTLRAARDSVRGTGHVAARDLVQRGAGALRARDRSPIALDSFRGDLRARALPVCACSARASADRRAGGRRSRCSATSRSTWSWRCCSASRRG